MADLKCPGHNPKVAAGTAWEFASEATAKGSAQSAQAKADIKASTAAMAALASHQCPPPCLSFPIVRFTKQGVVPVAVDPNADFMIATAFTDWELDVLCVEMPADPFQELLKPKPERPPDPEPGDLVGGDLYVAHLCETLTSVSEVSGEIKTIKVKCQGACDSSAGQCQVLVYPRKPIAGAGWTVAPDSVGGKTFRLRWEEAGFFYQCACLGKLP